MNFIEKLFGRSSHYKPAGHDFWYGPVAMDTICGAAINEQSAMGIAAVYSCVKILSEAIASLPLKLYKHTATGKQTAPEHPLYSVMHDSPNKQMTAYALREMMSGHVALRGNAFAYIERDFGTVKNLWPLHPSRMTVKATEGGQIVYEYRRRDGQKIDYPPDEILHLMGLTDNGLTGLSPLSLLRENFGRAAAISQYQSGFFAHGANPSGVLKIDQRLSKEQYQHISQSWADRNSGAANMRRVLILEEGLTWQQTALSNDDAQLVELAKYSTIEIARCFRIPLNLLQDLDRSTYSNIEQQNKSFLIHCLLPWLVRFEQSYNRALLTEGEREAGYFFQHVPDALLRGDEQTRYGCYQIALNAGFMTVNEVRQLENLNSIPGGDQPWAKNPVKPAAADRTLPNTGRAAARPGHEYRRALAQHHQGLMLPVYEKALQIQAAALQDAVDNNEDIALVIDRLYTSDDKFKMAVAKELRPALDALLLDANAATLAELGKNLDDDQLNKIATGRIAQHLSISHGLLLGMLGKLNAAAEPQVAKKVVEQFNSEITGRAQIAVSTDCVGIVHGNILEAIRQHRPDVITVSRAGGAACKWCSDFDGTQVHAAPPWHAGCQCSLETVELEKGTGT